MHSHIAFSFPKKPVIAKKSTEARKYNLDNRIDSCQKKSDSSGGMAPFASALMIEEANAETAKNMKSKRAVVAALANLDVWFAA